MRAVPSRPARTLGVGGLFVIAAAACSSYSGGDVSAAPSDASANALDGATAASDAGAEAALDAATPTSTSCATQLARLGASALFCADFDEPSAPLGGYIGGTFSTNAFTKDERAGGIASVQSGSLGKNQAGGRLVTDKPAQGTATPTGARYTVTIPVADPSKGLRIELDAYVHRTAARNALSMIGFGRGTADPLGDLEDNNGTPALVARIEGSVLAVLRSTAAADTSWHVEIVLDPDSATSFVLSGAINGVPMSADDSATSKRVGAALGPSFYLPLGPMSSLAGEGAASIQFDNVLVRTLR